MAKKQKKPQEDEVIERAPLVRCAEPVLAICSKCGRLTSCYSYPDEEEGAGSFIYSCSKCRNQLPPNF